jgi:sec-independent protein translocase protein TatB
VIFGVGLPEIMVLALIGLIVFGPERLPDMAAKAARGVKSLRAMATKAIAELNIESSAVTKTIGDLQSLTPRAIVGDVVSSVVKDTSTAGVHPRSQQYGQPLAKAKVRPIFDSDAT